MSFPFVFINLASIALLGLMFIFAFGRREVASTRSLCALMFFGLAWATGSFAELLAHGLAGKIFWRDFTQVGVFFVPPAALLFALSYSGLPPKRIRTTARILYSFQSIPVILIATDELHHFVRASCEIYYGPMGSATLAVKTTTLGTIFVSINFLLMAAALVVILLFFFRVASAMRSQIGAVVLGIAVPVVFAAFRVGFGESFAFGVPISCAFALGCALLLYGVYKLDFLSLEPIARDQAFDVIDEGIVIRSRDGKVVDINRAARRMLAPHLTLSDAENSSLKSEADAFLKENLDTLPGGTEPGGVDISLGKGGGKGLRYFNVKANWLDNAVGTRIGSVLVLRDITREVQLVEHLKRRAQRDGLTGLYNREALAELFESLAQLRQGPACLFIFDIDDFKAINDTYGHLAGDAILRAVCDRCGAAIRKDDIFSRIGGDEFVVFLPDIDRASAEDLARRLVKIVGGREFVADDGAIRATISLGAAMVDRSVDVEASLNEAIARADKALYQAKSEGKNRFVWEDLSDGRPADFRDKAQAPK
ncbi:diguanylate cyclase [bacterium]|nr:diguanylate cyclase [bacterium]